MIMTMIELESVHPTSVANFLVVFMGIIYGIVLLAVLDR
jgi:hypothetical protein